MTTADERRMIWLSYDGRRIYDRLRALGIELGAQDCFDLERAALDFFPNHIIGVIDACFTTGDRIGKLSRAQERGWGYFEKPVRQLLSKRESACRDAGEVPIAEAATVWQLAQARLLVRDMDYAEALILFSTIPVALRTHQITIDDIRQGIAICRDRDARTPYFLRGIVRKLIGHRMGMSRERQLEHAGQLHLWLPDTEPLTPAEIVAVEEEWLKAAYGIEVLKDLRTYVGRGAPIPE